MKQRGFEFSTRKIIQTTSTSLEDGRMWNQARATQILEQNWLITCTKLNQGWEDWEEWVTDTTILTMQVCTLRLICLILEIILCLKWQTFISDLHLFFSGQPHGPPTPPTTPKTDLHHGVKQDLKHEGRRLVDSSRQNIDFSNVDISELSTDVISNMETFDVHEFDQYLPLNGHASGSSDHSHSQAPLPGSAYTSSYSHTSSNGSTWSRKSSMSSSSPSTGEVGQHRLHIKTEQLSPSHYNEHSHGSPSHSDYGSYSSQACVTSATSAASAASSFSSSQCDYTDLQSSNYYNPYSSYPSSLYQYPYFHSSRRPYSSPILNSLSMAPPHSPNASSWDQPVYTTLSRP